MMKWNLLQWQSLKTRVTLLTLAIFVIGIWLLSFYVNRVLREDIQRLLGAQEFSSVSIIAAGVNEELEARLEALNTIAREVTPAMIDSKAPLQALLEQRPLLQNLFNGGVFVTGMDGTAIADVPLSAGRVGVNYMDRESIAHPLKEGKSIIGRPAMGKKLMAPIFSIVVPIFDKHGKVIAAMAGTINLGKPNFLDKVAAGQYGKSGGYLLIAPQHNLFVTASDKSRIMQPLPPPGINPMLDKYMVGYEGYGVAVSSRGVEELSAAKRIATAGWFIVVTLPTREAFAPIQTMQENMLAATTLLTLIAAGLIWWMLSSMLRRQFSPMIDATKTFSLLSGTNDLPNPLPISRQDEIGALIGSFNRLLETLAHRELALRESEERFSLFMDTLPAAAFIKDEDGTTLYANHHMALVLGARTWRGESTEKGLRPELPAKTGTDDLAHSALRHVVLEERVPDASGQPRLYQTYKFTIPRPGLSPLIGGIALDITEQRESEEKLKLAANVFTHAREGITITDRNGTIIDVNETFTRITGYGRDEVLGKNPRVLSSGRQTKEYYATMWQDLVEKGHWYGEVWNRHKTGALYAEMLTISAVRDETGETQNYVGLFSDITALKDHESQLEHIAHYDALTGLPNRVLLSDRLQQAMTQAQRREKRVAVAYLDLDGFKAVNDSRGHEAGDQLLVAVATRMKESLREGDTLARLGGDEFVAVLLDLQDNEASIPMLTRLLDAASQEVTANEQTLQVSASIGVTFYPQSGVDADQLLRQADQAMYQAKLAGKNRYFVFDAIQDT